MIPSASVAGRWVVATTAARGTRRSEGVALTAYGGSGTGAINIQQCGTIDASISGLGTDVAKSLVRCSATGTIERIATGSVNPSTDDVIGYAEADGRVHLLFGFPLAEILAIAGGGGGATPGGSEGDVQLHGGGVTFDGVSPGTAGNQFIVDSSGNWVSGRWIAGACTLEQFGAVGDGVTNDTAAWDAARAALAAGTYGTLILGAKTYLVNPTTVHPMGANIVGQGTGASVLKTTQARALILMYDPDAADRRKSTTLTNFRIVGSATGSLGASAPANQNGIEIGYLGADGAARVTVSNVSAYRLDRAFSAAESDEIAAGVLGENLLAEECKFGYYLASACDWSNCQAIRCNAGVRANGNVQFNGTLESCNVGVDLIAGGNDGHGVFSGRLVHCTIPIRSTGALANGFLFDGIELFEGQISIANGNTGAVIFLGGQVDATTYTLEGKSRWIGTTFDTAYFSSLSTTGGENEFVACRDQDGSIPSWIQPLLRVAYTFPGDANQTLSSQDSWAETLAIAAGVVTATRTITLGTRPPNRGNRILVKNATAQTVAVKWATGTAVNIATGLSAIVGADGTNATLELTESTGGGGGEANTSSNSGAGVGLAKAKVGVDLPFKSIIGSGVITATSNTNDCTLTVTGGSNGTFMRWASGVPGWGNDATYIALGGGTPSTAGHVRWPYATSGTLIGAKDSTATDRALLKWVGADAFQIGDGAAHTGWFDVQQLHLWGRSFVQMYSGSGGANTLRANGTTIDCGLPRIGWSTPYASEGRVTKNSGGTLSSTEYSRAILLVSSVAAGQTYTFPAPADADSEYIKWVRNTDPSDSITLSIGSGTTATVNANSSGTYHFSTSGVFKVGA
jgi:hypothetical protein